MQDYSVAMNDSGIDFKLVETADGSNSLYRSDLQETYHSNHGAFEESMHVYIHEGVDFYMRHHPERNELRVFEMGFGTGLNALLTMRTAVELSLKIAYHSIELYPVPAEVMAKLNYTQLPGLESQSLNFQAVVDAPWDINTTINDAFELLKIKGDLFEYANDFGSFDILYYDAFGLRAQPEVWEEKAFIVCFNLLKPGGVLVTYASNGTGRRAMEAAGFKVEKLQGAVGKREMIRAIKP